MVSELATVGYDAWLETSLGFRRPFAYGLRGVRTTLSDYPRQEPVLGSFPDASSSPEVERIVTFGSWREGMRWLAAPLTGTTRFLLRPDYIANGGV
jgi:hypothetical protein